MEMGGNEQVLVGLESENEGGNGRVKTRLVENEGKNLPNSSSKFTTTVLILGHLLKQQVLKKVT